MRKVIAALVTSILASTSALAVMPNTFSSGGTIKAAEINANFAYLEALISSSSSTAGNSLVMASASFVTNIVSTIYTAPSSTTSAYVIKQVFLPACNISASIIVGSTTIPLNSSGGFFTGLLIPVNANESVKVQCNASANFTTNAVIVLSK
jgi:hypothetical protein